ncbi:hypothetical protein LJC48_03285, partial [Desulfovibrio sp. OttesenSCG-928-C06]|nr:hypothetical protein [Desulfovibrio sp. OttesenSCG-928-C06]
RAARSDSLVTALRQASNSVDAAASAQAALERDWALWLDKTGLASENGMELTPAAAQDVFAVLEKIQERHALLEQKQAHKRTLESELAAFRSALGELSGALSGSTACIALCDECGLTVNPDNTLSRSGAGNQLNPNGKDMPGKGLFALFDGLYRAAEDCVAQSGLRQERHRDLAALQARIAEAETALRQCESSLIELFHLADLPGGEAASAFSGSSMKHAQASGLQEQAGLPGLAGQATWHAVAQPEQNGLPGQVIHHGFTELAELFRLRHAEYRAHENLRLERERCLMQLRQYAERFPARWSGYAELTEALDKLQADELKAEQENLEAELAAISASLLEDSTRQGEIKAMLLELERGGAYAELRQQEAALREELAGQARRWMVLNIARSSILAAKRSFEEDRQDMVVRQAGDFFRSMTGGAYRGLTFDLESGKGGLKALALPTNGIPLDAEHSLSRGTKEQLYLALRLAYIRQHNQTRESLPVVMDDILVNFDPGRAAKAASVLAEFASTNQVLFFTCHPGIAETLAGQSDKIGTGYSTFRVEGGIIS